MKIRVKVLLSTLVSLLLALVCTLVIVRALIVSYIEKEEIIDVQKNYQRFVSIIEREEAAFENILHDWSQWDDAYQFEADRSMEFIDTNLRPETLNALKINFMIFLDKDYQIIHKNMKDMAVSEEAFVNDLLSAVKSNQFFADPFIYKSVTGITKLGGNPLLISASPVTSSDGTAPGNGFLIIGRYLDRSLRDYMEQVLQVKLQIAENSGQELTAASTSKIQTVVTGNGKMKIEEHEANIVSYASIADLLSSRAIPVRFELDRELYKNGYDAIRYFGLIFLIAIIIVECLSFYVFDRLITQRIRSLHNFVNNVTSSRDTTSRIAAHGRDEISMLAVNMNKMLEELDSSYKTDPTTTLKNRAYMESMLKEECSFKEYNSWLIMGDVNGLKIVNDSFGHQEGDRLLRTVGGILKRCCSEEDIPARWGGDEFLILVKNADISYVENMIGRIKAECEQVLDYPFRISMAMGSAGKDEKYFDPDAVLKLAEERMYRNKLLESRSTRSAIIFSLEQSLHEKHIETEEHTKRIEQMCLQIGKSLALSQEELDELALLGVLHDIGKIAIPESVLLKPDKLTAEEWGIMKTHTEIGYRIASSTPELAYIANEILYHHERFDGTGYPHGLAGKSIPKLSRLLAIVDSFDVMTHDRIYKRAMSVQSAVQELKQCSGTQFDPEMVDAFLKLLEENAFQINDCE